MHTTFSFKSITHLFLTPLLCFGLVQPSLAQEADTHSAAQALMQNYFEQNKTPGMAVSVGLNDQLVWSAGFGFADLEQQVRVDPAETRFRFGSVIKSMTAFATAQLVDQGKLDLDAPVQTYVPFFPVKQAPISTRQLLAHLGGVRHYNGNEFLNHKQYNSIEQGLEIFANDPLEHVPGTAYRYSSYGYNLISAVIENAAGQDYLGFMQENVFGPLQLESIVPDVLHQIIPGRGRYYHKENAEILNSPEVNNSYKWASGGYIGTSDDLVRFGLAQLNDGRISPETQKMYWTEQHTVAGEPTGYGLGWRITKDANNNLWIGHGGGSVGGTTAFWMMPEKGLVITAISNLSEYDFGTVLVDLSEIFAPSAD